MSCHMSISNVGVVTLGTFQARICQGDPAEISIKVSECFLECHLGQLTFPGSL